MISEEKFKKKEIINKSKKSKALFLDRDGVINIDYGYVHKKENFEFRDEIFSICRMALTHEYKIIIVTNQSGIGQDLYTENDFYLLNDFMISKFLENNILITDVYYCPYHPSKGKGKYFKDSFNRKPNPGMLYQAEKDHQLDLKNSIMIGDKESDFQASINAKINYYIDAREKDWEKDFLELIKNISKN